MASRKMSFINNFSATLESSISADGATLPVSQSALSRLSGGRYTLCIASSVGCEAVSHEIVIYEDGVVERAAEGTAAQSWPAGSVVYAPITAGLAEAAAAGVEGMIADIERELGVQRPAAPKKYKVATRSMGYSSTPRGEEGFRLIAPTPDGVVAARAGYDTLFSEPPSVLIARKSGGGVATSENPQGVNWSRYGDLNHGYHGFSSASCIDDTIYLMPISSGPDRPPVAIENTPNGFLSIDIEAGDYNSNLTASGFALGTAIYTPNASTRFNTAARRYEPLHEVIPRDTQWVVTGDSAVGFSSGEMYQFSGLSVKRKAALSRQIDIGLGSVFVGRNGRFYAHDYITYGLVSIGQGGDVSDHLDAPRRMVWAQSPDGDLVGLLRDDTGTYMGFYDTGTDAYTDTSSDIMTEDIDSALLAARVGLIHAHASTDRERGVCAAYSGGAFYYVASATGRWAVICITKT